jgi:hypothetical protein
VRLILAAALAFALLGATSAFAITRAGVLARGQVWIDRQVPYSQSKYFGGYRTDCSGFTSMSWQTTSNGHAISYSTRSLHNVASTIPSGALLPGDALVKYNYHAKIFYGWVDAAHTMYVCYEQTGPTTKSSIKNLAADLAFGYVPYRYRHIAAGPPQWNALANPTFDVWASGAPVWWQVSGGSASSVCTRSLDVVKSSHNALGLLNPSARTRDVVDVSQTASVTAGEPYTTSVWARTLADPVGLTLRLRFLDAAGRVLSTLSTTGADWSLKATAFAQMSLTATAPATATSASVSVVLAGGVDASQTAGTSAVLDDIRLFDSSRAGSAASLSSSSTVRHRAVKLSGQVTAPIPCGTVRVYMQRPDRKTPAVLVDKTLVRGAWSLTFKPGLRGTYRFSARYLGFGPWGAVTSPVITLKVR